MEISVVLLTSGIMMDKNKLSEYQNVHLKNKNNRIVLHCWEVAVKYNRLKHLTQYLEDRKHSIHPSLLPSEFSIFAYFFEELLYI